MNKQYILEIDMVNNELQDSFAIATDRTMKYFSSDTKNMKTYLIGLVDEALNYMNPHNRKHLREGEDIGKQYYLVQNLDGIFELVKKYLPEDVDYLCTRAYFSAVHQFAKKHNAEIENIAKRRLDLLLDEKEDYKKRLLKDQDNLKNNKEYQELKQLENSVEFSDAVKKLIKVRIDSIEHPLINLKNKINECEEQVIDACVGRDLRDAHRLIVTDYINKEYLASRNQKRQEKNPSTPNQ